ncbi:MAG TPA: amidohydrolase family protein, partial [Thermoanaerobaculia bacterium]|nr:amidohydrolase family protein [Thermoanaerobaculia bacterium]
MRFEKEVWMKARMGAVGFALAALAVAAARGQGGEQCWTIVGARVADGTGRPVRNASVEVCGDTISRVGAFSPGPADRVVKARGLVLAPGFIDIHNHSTEGLAKDRAVESQVSQGITTLVVGADGDSPWPIADYLGERRAAPAAVNVLAIIGHATVREKVMGSDFKRAARPDEIAAMANLVEEGMRQGAVGLSSGLEYEVGSYSETPELVELARAAARHGGFYMTHIRDEADKSFEAFREAIRIGREGGIPVQISHIKLATVNVWHQVDQAIRLFQEARGGGLDLTADCYPYTAWHSNIEVLVPDKKYDDQESVGRALADVGGAANITITECRAHPEYAGRNLESIAAAQSITPIELFIRIVKEGGADVIGHSMKEEDVEAFYRQPWVMVASDGGIGSSHPRGTGTFPKVLGRYVREKRLFSLSEAIRKMTALPAQRLKLSDRGRIARGLKADLVLFDPAAVVDRSTFESPATLSEGIRLVAVNGRSVWENGKPTGATPGRVLPETAGSAEIPRDAGGIPAARVDALFEEFDRTDSPGCALAVLRDGRVAYKRGYGMASLELSVPITPETVFDIGSAEKQFAAAAIVLLAQEGKLSLDDDIRKWLPEIPSYGGSIALRHLLHHT